MIKSWLQGKNKKTQITLSDDNNSNTANNNNANCSILPECSNKIGNEAQLELVTSVLNSGIDSSKT